jgi:hypothetical protein
MTTIEEITTEHYNSSSNIKKKDYSDLEDRLDCLQKSVANLRTDIPKIIEKKIRKILDDRDWRSRA